MPLCVICQDYFNPSGSTGEPPFDCECGANLDARAAREMSDEETDALKKAWINAPSDDDEEED